MRMKKTNILQDAVDDLIKNNNRKITKMFKAVSEI